MGLGHRRQRHGRPFHRPDQPHAAFDFAVVEHEARRRNLHRRAPGLCVDERQRAGVGEAGERIGERDRLVAFAPGDGQKAGFSARARMGVDRAAIGDGEGIRRQRLEADIVGPRGDRALDAGREQLFEGGEQDVLQLDGQRQQPVEEGGDGRQLVAQTALVRQPEAGRIFERVQRASFHLALEQQQIELAQRIARIGAFQIVLGPEETLAAGLALAARDGAERVETPGDGREKTLLGLDVGRDRAEQRRLRLVGAIGAAEALDRGIGLPAGFQEIMDAEPPVLRREIGMVAAPGAARIREDQDALRVIHEGLRLGEIRPAGAVLDREAVDAAGRCLSDDAPGAAGHLRHHLRAEALHDLIERAMDGRQRRQFLDQPVAARDRLAAQDRLAVAAHRTRGEIALLVGERLVELHREAVREIIEDIFARRDVDLDIAPFLGRDFGEAALHQRFAGRDDLDDGGMARPRYRA